MTSKNTLVLVAVLALLVTGLLGYYLYSINQKGAIPESTETPSQLNVAEEPTAPVIPTRTAEEIKIIAQIKDYNIDITKEGFSPSSVEIKVHDQVFFINKDSVVRKVKGENWGGVPIGPGERFVQSFDQPGTYDFTDEENPALKGVITVK